MPRWYDRPECWPVMEIRRGTELDHFVFYVLSAIKTNYRKICPKHFVLKHATSSSRCDANLAPPAPRVPQVATPPRTLRP